MRLLQVMSVGGCLAVGLAALGCGSSDDDSGGETPAAVDPVASAAACEAKVVAAATVMEEACGPGASMGDAMGCDDLKLVCTVDDMTLIAGMIECLPGPDAYNCSNGSMGFAGDDAARGAVEMACALGAGLLSTTPDCRAKLMELQQ